MSQLIDQLKDQSGDPRSTRELTLVYGDQAAQEGRQDIFANNPDFAKEYAGIKDEISRYNRPGLGQEFEGGLQAGGDEMLAAGEGLGALGANAVGADTAAQSLLTRARANQAAAAAIKPSVPSITDVSADHPVDDISHYLARDAGSLIPSLGLAAVSSAAGAAAGTALEPGGGTIAGGLAGAAEGLGGDAAAQITKLAAQKIGGEAALAGAFSAQSAGANYVRHPETPGADLAFGVANGVLGAVAPGYVLGKLLPAVGEAATQDATQAAMGYWTRFANEAAKTIPIGAGTTAASALVDIAADKYARGEDPSSFTADDYKAALNAGIIGGLGGAIMAPLAAIPGAHPDSAATSAPEAPPAAAKIDTTGLPSEVADAVSAVEAKVAQAVPPVEATPEVHPDVEQLPAAPVTAPPANSNPPLSDLVGREVEYAGYRGTLTRDDEGNFVVLKAVTRDGEPNQIEVADTGKDPATLSGDVGLNAFEKSPDPTWKVVSTAQRGDVPGMVMVETKAKDGSTILTSPEELVKQGYVMPPMDNVPQGEYTVGQIQQTADQQAQRIPDTKVPVPSADNVMPAAPPEDGIQYTIQRAQPHPVSGDTIPGYIQLDRTNADGRGEPLTDQERAAFPAPPDHLETGQYSLDQVRDAIANPPPESSSSPSIENAQAEAIRGIARPVGEKSLIETALMNRDGAQESAYRTITGQDYPSENPSDKTLLAAMNKFMGWDAKTIDEAKGLAKNLLPEADEIHAEKVKSDLVSVGQATQQRLGDQWGGFASAVTAANPKDIYGILQKFNAPSGAATYVLRNLDAVVQATERTSGDYLSAPSSAANLLDSTVKALALDRDVPVMAISQAVSEAVGEAVKTSGVTITPQVGGKIVGYALDTTTGALNPQSVLSLLHEAGHVFTDGLEPNLRSAFQQAITELPWAQQRWLMNPESLDVRLMASANPESLSPKQRGIIAQLTPAELAAARTLKPEQLAQEQMAEHLAQLGWDKQEATTMVDRFFRFVKDLWLKTAMAIQKALKGDDQVSPELAQQFTENRFLQFINRDAAFAQNRINDLLNWIGVPATTRERQPSFPGGADNEMRMQFADRETGQMIPVSYAIFTPDAQQAYLQRAVDNAARYVQGQRNGPPVGDDAVEFSRRANFSKPLPFDPSGSSNVALAAINLEDEIYNSIRNDRNIAGLLPRVNGVPIGHPEFMSEWMKIPGQQFPEARRQTAVEFASKTTDPLTGQPVKFDPKTTIEQLPSYTETLQGKEKEAVQIKLSEQQDEALRQTIWSLRDTQRRLQSKLQVDTDRLNNLVDQRTEQEEEFPTAAQKELDQLQRDTLMRAELVKALVPRIDQLDAKFDPSAAVKVYPTAEYLRVPERGADEGAILQNRKGVVPRDLNFSTESVKSAFGQDLADMKSWLDNPDNRSKGVIYGRMDETYRKLMQIPVDLQRANTFGVLRRTITNGLADELRLSGLPALVNLGKKFTTSTRIINENRVDAQKLGVRWSEAFGKFAQSLGKAPDQSFKETYWDPLMRVWNNIDVSRRADIKGNGPTAPVDLTAAAMSKIAGLEIKTPQQRETLRDLMLATVDNERHQMSIETQNNIRVNDPELGYERRLIPRGLAAGRRTIARHMTGLYMRMNPDWSGTAPISEQDPRSFWAAAKDLYQEQSPDYKTQIDKLFPSYVRSDFVEPLVNNNTPIFDAPASRDDSAPRKAALVRVRQAWRDGKGDITKFAESLHRLEGGDKGDEGQTVDTVLSALRTKFYELKGDQDGRIGSEGIKREILPRQIMDARLAHDWPAEWTSYSTYNPADNFTVLHQLAVAAGLGRDALAQNSEINMTLAESKRDLAELWAKHEELVQQGLNPKQVEAQMGTVNAQLARRFYPLSENIDNVSRALTNLTTNTGYLSGDFKAFNSALGFGASMMTQTPRSGAINIIGDIQGPLAALKFSRPGLKAFWGAGTSVARDMATSLVRAMGVDVKFNTDLAHELYVNGASDPDQFITWRQKQSNYGPGQVLSKPSGYETTTARAGRTLTRAANLGRDILTNIGSPFDKGAAEGDEEAAVAPKLRAGFFGTTALSTTFANNRAGYTAFSDLAMRGVKYLNSLPESVREQTVRALELGGRDLDNRQLGYNRGLLLNDEAAFNYMKDAVETKMSGESSVGRFVAKAYRRQQAAAGGKWPILANSQFSDIINLTNSEWTLQNNLATVPPWMNGPLRPLFTFLTWPYQAMHRFGRTFVDPRGRLTFNGLNSTVADGMKTFFVVAAPATVAGSFAIDLYDKYALGKKQNLREASLATALPVVGPVINPAGFMERIGRYGSAGFATDVLNRIVNYDTQRNLSLDDRIVAVSSIENLLNTVAVEPFQTGGNITYSSTVRPFLQSVGAGGVLQYLQIANNLLGLNNEEAAMNARINTGNYLRAAGRQLELPVRVASGPAESPTPISPYLTQMALGAIIDNPDLFRSAMQNAVEAARQQGQEDPLKYVAQAFADKHPLRSLFAHSISDADYRNMLGEMDDRGAGQVRQAVNNYNRYLGAYFNKQPYYGKVEKEQSIDDLIRQSTRLQHSDLAAQPVGYY